MHYSQLIDAVSNGYLDKIQKYVSNGLAINKRHQEYDSKTLLHIASQNNQRQILKFLLENGGDLNIRDTEHNTPLHLAAGKGHYDIALLLTSAGAEIDAKGTAGWTALHMSSYMGHIDITNHLVSCNDATLNFKDDVGSTALHYAALKGHDSIIKLLLLKGGDINALNSEKHTPLDLSIIGEHIETEELICNLGGKTYNELSKNHQYLT